MQWPWKKAETELERELRYHVETMADALERQGYSRQEALRRARVEFGGVEQFKEQCRDERRWQLLAQLIQDLTFGYRMLRRAPAVTGAAVLSLALGIGATTAILSLVDAVLWRNLAVPHPEQLTEILWQSKSSKNPFPDSSFSGSMYDDGPLLISDSFSRPAFDAMRDQAADLAAITAHQDYNNVSTSYDGTTAVVQYRPVSGNFFVVLGVQPMLGRLIAPNDDDPAAPMAVVVSHQYWESALKRDANVIGRSLRINHHPFVIAGVLPASFGGIRVGEATDIYTSIAHGRVLLDPQSFWARRAPTADTLNLQLLARRKSGVSNEVLAARLDPLFMRNWPKLPEKPEMAATIRAQDASAGLGDGRRGLRTPLSMLFALVGLVLLIACTNIANLLLARADSRREEVALRVSLGCGRARLIRQFFTESALLAAGGGVLSIAVAYVTANFAVTLMPGTELRLQFDISGRMLLATLAVTAFTALLFGLYPAWRASQLDAAPALKEASRSLGGKLLVSGQVALAVLLVAAATVFTGHLRKVLTRDTGFERTRLLMFDVRPGESGYAGLRLRQFYIDLEQRLRGLPGVEAVALNQVRPMKNRHWHTVMSDDGARRIGSPGLNFVTVDYMRALGVPMLAGRGLSEHDIRSQARVAVVSEDFAKALGVSPLGARFMMGGKPYEVIGVAARARYDRLTAQPQVLYLPNSLEYGSATVLLRTSVPPMQVLAAVRGAVRELDRDLPVAAVLTMEQQIAESLRRERLFAWLCGSFGVLAFVLCMIGLYGVMSYSASRRGQEMGIRMVLGASPRDVLRHVIGEGMAVAARGLVIGGPVAYLALRKYVDYKSLGMQPLDGTIIAGTLAGLAAAALLAVLAPALRAAWSDPVKAIRQG